MLSNYSAESNVCIRLKYKGPVTHKNIIKVWDFMWIEPESHTMKEEPERFTMVKNCIEVQIRNKILVIL